MVLQSFTTTLKTMMDGASAANNKLLLLLLLLLVMACRADGRGQFFYLPRIRAYNGGATGEALFACQMVTI
jgi:hypothetical protein